MKIAAVMLALSAFAAPADPGPAIPYFAKTRDVAIAAPGQQTYFVVDPAIWAHARPDLTDLRLYHGESQVPFTITAQHSATISEQSEARILNLGSVAGQVEFDLDMQGIPEYDRVQLRLGATNFVATASAEGRASLGDHSGAKLGTSTLYDFSREKLGSSTVLRLPASTFPYLHLRLGPGIEAKDVQGATVSNVRESKASWAAAGTCRPPQAEKRDTVIACDLLPGVPITRVLLQVTSEHVNFRRTVTISDAQQIALARSSISRIRMNRGGTTVVSEDLVVNLPAPLPGSTFTIRIDNGDDPPLSFDSVQPQSLERRVYFDPQGQAQLKVYYGDPKLGAPVYDYAKFFKEDEAASQAALGPEQPNTSYTGRPDDRPWSERHSAVLWIAMIAAVAVLAALALRGMIAGPSSAG